MIITISREIGANASLVATRVAAALGWRVVDNELVERVATRSGLSPAEVAEKEERAPGFLERLIRLLTKAAPEIFPAPADEVPELEEAKLVEVTKSVVTEIAAEGRVVLVGRAAAAVLRRDRDALHLKIVAPFTRRVEVVIQRDGLAPADAETRVRDIDDNRKRYYRQHFDRDWNDPSQYHLVLNTAFLGIDAVVEIIVTEARRMWPGGVRV